METENMNTNPTTSAFFESQIITYIGNKRKLLPALSKVFDCILQQLTISNSKPKSKKYKRSQIITGDGFSGSGIVSRLLKTKSDILYTNDCSGYSYALNNCFLSTLSQTDYQNIKQLIQIANTYADNETSLYEPWVSKHWSPQESIQKTDRVYFTRENGIRIDKYRYFIEHYDYPLVYKQHILSALLVKVSIHNNTSGQFSAFYKDEYGIGKFGGKKEDDISRITKPIVLDVPLYHSNPCEVHVSRKDIIEWIYDIPEVDILYLDPPYNKHPYSIFYFLLDIVYDWNIEETIPDTYRGQPKTWVKSPYNSFIHAESSLRELIRCAKAKFIVFSYNNKGIVPIDKLEDILKSKGKVTRIPVEHKVYNRLKGIANYKRTVTKNEKVNEFIWIVDCR